MSKNFTFEVQHQQKIDTQVSSANFENFGREGMARFLTLEEYNVMYIIRIITDVEHNTDPIIWDDNLGKSFI